MGFSLSDHVELLERFLAQRQEIVDALESRLFSARGKAAARGGDRESVADIFDACFFGLPSRTLYKDGYSRDLDPVELVLRACYYWDHDRWPGRSGRIDYVESLYVAFVLRQLELLSLRIWDEEDGSPEERLQRLQRQLDRLNSDGRAPFVRSARWLIQTAQGPLTPHLEPYFTTAAKISKTLTPRDRVEIHKAGATLAGGHLRSQLRHLSWQTGWAFEDPRLLGLTRSSNSMDMELLVRDLVPLLSAYRAACATQEPDNIEQRLDLADAILQGLSADPELLLTRLDLLAPSTTIEELFLHRSGNGQVEWTPMGEAHLDYLKQYAELIADSVESLKQDAQLLYRAHALYSPLGIVYGFCADLFANMALNTLRPSPLRDLSLEDMFNSRERLEEKRAQAREWTQLPKGEGERDPFEHSSEWTELMVERLVAALESRGACPTEPNASRKPKASLYVVPRGVALESLPDGVLPAGIVSVQEHCLTSKSTRASANGETVLPASRLVADRAEGRFLASTESSSNFFGISKVVLTVCSSQGKDALATNVPTDVIDVLRAVCPDLLVVCEFAG